MGPTCKSYVLELLENSSHRLRQIELMRYELQQIPQITDSEMIEAMSLPSLTNSEKAASSKAVPDVALSYKRTAERINAEALSELASAYVDLWREHDRLCTILDYWMSANAEYSSYTTLSRMCGQTLQRLCT